MSCMPVIYREEATPDTLISKENVDLKGVMFDSIYTTETHRKKELE